MPTEGEEVKELSHRLTQWVDRPGELALVTAQLRRYDEAYELRLCEGQYAVFVSEKRVGNGL
ncbi:hypothetical protein ACFLT7_06725 [candidate division KSB1 bacterium]